MKSKTSKKPKDPLQKVAHRLNYEEGLRLFLQEQEYARNFFVFPWLEDLRNHPDTLLQRIQTKCEQGYALEPKIDIVITWNENYKKMYPLLGQSDHILYNTLIACLLYVSLPETQNIFMEEAFELQNINWKDFQLLRIALMRKPPAPYTTNRQPVSIAFELQGYYSSIDHQKLATRLPTLKNFPDREELLYFLNLWSQGYGQGLPEGYAASEILAEFYYQPLWDFLEFTTAQPGLTYLRYNQLQYIYLDETWTQSRTDALLENIQNIFRMKNLSIDQDSLYYTGCNRCNVNNIGTWYSGSIVGPHYHMLHPPELYFDNLVASCFYVHPLLLESQLSGEELQDSEIRDLFQTTLELLNQRGNESEGWRYAVLHWCYHHRDRIPDEYEFLQFCRSRAYLPQVHYPERMYYLRILQKWGVEKDREQIQQWLQTRQVIPSEWNRYPDRDTFLGQGLDLE